MSEFEKLLQEHLLSLERYVKFKINNKHDAEDMIQVVCLTATEKFPSLKNKTAFKAWLIGIASHKCNDYYRKKAKEMHISLEVLSESALSKGGIGITETNIVRDTLDLLGDKEKQILYLYFFKNLSHEEIATHLSIPIGTVKSRLHYAKEKFREQYPRKETAKGEAIMKKLPAYIPAYKIERSPLASFPVRWEEIMGWCLVPKIGEKLTWAMYAFPTGKCTELCEMEVVGKAEVHGIQGVEILAAETNLMDRNSAEGQKKAERRFVAQLTESHCRLLAESHEEDGIKRFYTFLDGEAFLGDWGFGEDNCGNEIDIAPKGDITRDGAEITVKEKTSFWT